MYEFVGKLRQMYKLNSNCKEEEKGGRSGPGSCSNETNDPSEHASSLIKNNNDIVDPIKKILSDKLVEGQSEKDVFEATSGRDIILEKLVQMQKFDGIT